MHKNKNKKSMYKVRDRKFENFFKSTRKLMDNQPKLKTIYMRLYAFDRYNKAFEMRLLHKKYFASHLNKRIKIKLFKYI